MNRKIILIAPEPPPFGGMANQARLLADCLEREGIRVHFVPTNRAPDIISRTLWLLPVFRTGGKFLIYLVELMGFLKHCGTIHIMACSHVYFYLNVVPAVLIGRLFSKLVVVNYRGGEAESFFKGVAGYFLSIFRLVDSLIVPSGYLQAVFRELGYRSRIIPNIAEVKRFNFSSPNYKDPVRFVCTRNFEAYYDILTLIRAFGRVKKMLPDSKLTLIGDGSMKQEILNAVEAVGLNGCVDFLGKVAPHDMPEHLRRYDIYVNSSVVDNYPISLLEAFSCGLPVVSTAAGGIPYLVDHEVTGILVPPGDDEALAKEMIRLAEDPDLGRRLAMAAKKVADEIGRASCRERV